MIEIKVRRFGNSLGVVLPKEVINRLNTRDGEHLMAQLSGQGAFEIFPESPTEVFWKVVDAQATFKLGPDGRAEGLILHQNGRDLPATRIP